MITEFTCGIYHADKLPTNWVITVNQYPIAHVVNDGTLITFSKEFTPPLLLDDLIEIAVLMNNIKRQYKQLQTN